MSVLIRRLKVVSIPNKLIFQKSKRKKHKNTHWSVVAKKKTASDKALEHFDDFYGTVFGGNWTPIRCGLLSKQKYVAVVNNFSDVDRIKRTLECQGALNLRTLVGEIYATDSYAHLYKCLRTSTEQKTTPSKEQQNEDEKEKHANAATSMSLAENLATATMETSRVADSLNAPNLYEFIPATKIKGKEDWVPETQHYQYYDAGTASGEFAVKIEAENSLRFPEHLHVYCFDKEEKTTFEPPRKGTTEVLDYYCMDGGSILPVLALGTRPGDSILDVCSSPGGKALVALQTLHPSRIVCNDVTPSRVDRIKSVLRQYLYDLDSRWIGPGHIVVQTMDARCLEPGPDNFDRVLVDVPCTTDRHSLKEEDNNWFKASRIKERLKLPELQSAILASAAKMVRPGGTVVYSTCSLSPVQNDGVVHMALKELWQTTNMQFVVKDLTVALGPYTKIYKFADTKLLRYGHLVLPWPGVSYGPTYFCKLHRVQ